MSTEINRALHYVEDLEKQLRRLETLLGELRVLYTAAQAEGSQSAQRAAYQRLRQDYIDGIGQLIPIEGWTVTTIPPAIGAATHAIDPNRSPLTAELREYRARLSAMRNEIVRPLLRERIPLVDSVLETLAIRYAPFTDLSKKIEAEDWTKLRSLVRDIDRLLGTVRRTNAWGQLSRHLFDFGFENDLNNILTTDWPTVKRELLDLVDAGGPAPIPVRDLAELLSARGPVAPVLAWDNLDDEGFERLMFALVSSTDGYVEVDWQTNTRAPDLGRDLSALRVFDDPLSGEIRQRLIVQCRHWRSRSITDTDVAAVLAKMEHWRPDVLIIATSGWFTAAALQWIDRVKERRMLPVLELWAGSRLEQLIARRTDLAAQFRLI